MGNRNNLVDSFAELTKYVHSDWRINSATINISGPGDPTATLKVESVKNPDTGITDFYRWDGHAWILINSKHW